MRPTLYVRCPRCGSHVDTGFRIPASSTVLGRVRETKTCLACGATFDYRSGDTFNDPAEPPPR